MSTRPTRSTLVPYTTLFRSRGDGDTGVEREQRGGVQRAERQPLLRRPPGDGRDQRSANQDPPVVVDREARLLGPEAREDRKSTRLNSSHMSISYAVFCLKTK